jgi:phospholipid/cholesterol/gamma-HCH transport system substrate-binding protein
MNNSPQKRAVIVGIFVFVGLVILVISILIIGNLNETFKKKIEVVALFEDVSGLKVGNNVWFSGVKIGSISNLQFYDQTKVKVMLNIEEKSQEYIRKDAFVKLSTDGLIGNKILIIYGGTLKEQQIEEGDTLGVEKTFSSDDMINTLQKNNENLLAITNDFKVISHKIANGEGTIGKLITDDAIYTQINEATISLQHASDKAQQLISALSAFSQGLNKEGTLAHELTTDTVIFNSLKTSVLQLQEMASKANALITNLKEASTNNNTPVGVLLNDEESGTSLKQTIKNLETSSQKLDEDLKAAQHSFLLKGYFKDKQKAESK